MSSIKTTTQSVVGTSFHNVTIRATVKQLRQVLGEPAYEGNDGQDKCNFEWECETSDGTVFTVYDWKQYRRLKETEPISFHIGTLEPDESHNAYRHIKAELMKLASLN